MAKIKKKHLKSVRIALREYEAEVKASGLSPTTKDTYILHATNFVRWLEDDFRPGGGQRAR